jgi:carboxylesterase type B
MIFVFGGGFVRGSRDHEGYLPYFKFLNDNGFDVVSIDYRLGLKPLTTMKEMPSVRETIGL